MSRPRLLHLLLKPKITFISLELTHFCTDKKTNKKTNKQTNKINEKETNFVWNLNPSCTFWHFICPVWNSHEPRGSCNYLENRAHMVASVPALTCHVTAVMGLSMAAQTTVSQELVSCGSSGRGWEDEVPWSAGRSKILINRRWVKEPFFRCKLSIFMYEQHEVASDEFISEEPFLLGVSFVCLFFVKTVT